MSLTLSPQHAPSVYSIPAAATSGVLLSLSIRLYKIPLVLLFFFIPIPLAFTAELRNLGDVVKLGLSV